MEGEDWKVGWEWWAMVERLVKVKVRVRGKGRKGRQTGQDRAREG